MQAALLTKQPIRAIIIHFDKPDLIASRVSASIFAKYFPTSDLIGTVTRFDGDELVIEFRLRESCETLIKILVADDHAIVRAGLNPLISREADMMVISEAASGAEAVSLAASTDCDVVLLDVVMPDADGLDILRQIL